MVDQLRGFSAAKISSLMKISDKLGTLNRDRFRTWERPFTRTNAKQALLAFQGDVYRGLNSETFSAEDFRFAQKHLRILSGLYGVLRPFDLIQPYRLEMGTKLKNERGKDLYEFWGDRITQQLNKQLRSLNSNTVVNLASIEYSKSVDTDLLKADVIAPVFLDEKNGKYKIISFYAKKARGMMAGWMIRNQVDDLKQFRKFKLGGYRFSADLSSSEREPTFVRDE